MKKKVELLAPAGNYECFLGAIHAGADAVYLSGNKYGARAYASNFTQEELCDAIIYAHLYSKKIYLTINTLFKENELEEIYEYICPYYEVGLDGVIIQDIGLFHYMKRQFPRLELHCSTQMSITGALGAQFAKDMGATRIVPARELSFDEIKQMIDTVDIEVECFVHGSMCYCFSGQCLFSSVLGGRSGNRGRCAQPCRLPYSTDKKSKEETYLLSLKDLCTIDYINELIESGITSFKIEGRMKQPEYVAGVTRIYRKYIDRYYDNPSKAVVIETEDKSILNKLYIRSETMDGYYKRQNGTEMVTLNKPGYQKNDEQMLQKIRESNCFSKQKIEVCLEAEFLIGQPAKLTITKGDVSVTVLGSEVSAAQKSPLEKDRIQTQLEKFGNTNYRCKNCSIVVDKHIFYSMKELNELRRMAITQLERKLIELQPIPNQLSKENVTPLSEETLIGPSVIVKTKEQLSAVMEQQYFDNIIIDALLCLENDIMQKLKAKANTFSYYIAFPYIIRNKDIDFLEKVVPILNHNVIKGILVRNLEGLQFLLNKKFKKQVIIDPALNIINMESYRFMKEYNGCVIAPFELNSKELRQLRAKGYQSSKVVYGRIPMMISANCIKETEHRCNKKSEIVTLYDRYDIAFPVSTECAQCYNIIYNSVPLSLHKSLDQICKNHNIILAFTIETKEETTKILEYFCCRIKEQNTELAFVLKDYTTGHEKKGIE